MRKLVARVLICLLLGAATTIVIAWSCALWSPMYEQPKLPRGDWGNPADESDLRWLKEQDNDLVGTSLESARRVNAWKSRGFGISRMSYMILSPPSRDDPYRPVVVSRQVSGWPMACTEGGQFQSFLGISPTIDIQFGRWSIGWSRNETWRAITYRPLWLGLIIDVAIFAAMWMLLLWSGQSLIRGRRALRGLCPMCKYDLRGNLAGGCSECGWRRVSDAANPEHVAHESPGGARG